MNVLQEPIKNQAGLSAAAGRMQSLALPKFVASGFGRFLYHEAKYEGLSNCLKTIGGSVRKKDLVFSPERTLGEELATSAERFGDRIFLSFEGQDFSYAELNQSAARVAQFMLSADVKEGDSIGLLLPNIPAFLEVFFATQRIGACAVPTNTSLVGEGLAYIINNAGCVMLFTVASLLPELGKIAQHIERALMIVVVPEFNDESEPIKFDLQGCLSYRQVKRSPPQTLPRSDIDTDTTSMLMYTSGTTGYPKGVVYSYGASQAKMLRVLAHLLVTQDDVYYTCLPLFHANALMVTVISSLYTHARVALYRKFSARNFWREINESKATIVNTLGSMIAILMKQPPSALDGQHCLRRVLSAACPADLWWPFEQRFQVKLTECFGAVDGGGITTMNVGNAPFGSIGKPLGKTRWRLVDGQGNDVPVGVAGELIHYVGNARQKQVKYHNNAQASAEKTRSGWVYSGDLLRTDEQGFLYFVGRSTDSMRCGGENVSALVVESAANQFESVLESAAYAVPSDLAEDDIMLAVQSKDAEQVDPARLYEFLKDKLAKFQRPRYIRIVDALPKTETHRTVKHQLKREGVTCDTWRAPQADR